MNAAFRARFLAGDGRSFWTAADLLGFSWNPGLADDYGGAEDVSLGGVDVSRTHIPWPSEETLGYVMDRLLQHLLDSGYSGARLV